MKRIIFKPILFIIPCLIAISNSYSQTAQLIVSPNDTVCPNDSVTITIQNSTGTVFWSTGSFGLSIMVNPTITTTYYAINDYGGTNDTLYATITVRTVQSFIDIHPGGMYCKGDTFFSILLINPIGSVLWSTGDTTNVIFVSPPTTQTYWFINDVGTNCADTVYETISVFPDATPVITTTSSIFCNGMPATVSLNNPVGNILWSTGETTSSISVIPSFNSYLYVINDYQGNCPDTGYISINGIPSEIWLPNAFSPNDDGENDDFKIYGGTPSEFRLRIFNRWGEKLFDSNNPNEGWDGKHKEQECPSGVYSWVVSYFNSCSDNMQQISGNVTLLR
ncbi:MAG: gliding motility-associated C-terminal domain-containing protein [Bacteroidetes bacterium]|nr:gliding motility-associated C-terminal domain-containing protein [Bacteroidota bacterium]